MVAVLWDGGFEDCGGGQVIRWLWLIGCYGWRPVPVLTDGLVDLQRLLEAQVAGRGADHDPVVAGFHDHIGECADKKDTNLFPANQQGQIVNGLNGDDLLCNQLPDGGQV
jgi:hypothetical protein